jgi:hypothetical protein
MEKLFWRDLSANPKDPVCIYSEAEWIKYLISLTHQYKMPEIYDQSVVSPNHDHLPAQVIYKQKSCRPTGLVIQTAQHQYLGTITDIYGRSGQLLRPFRPHAYYSPDTSYGLAYLDILSHAGFDESESTINILMTLLRQLNLPVNPLLPQIVSSYWSE